MLPRGWLLTLLSIAIAGSLPTFPTERHSASAAEIRARLLVILAVAIA